MKVEGVIEVAGPPIAFPGGPVHVFVEDASFADAAAVVVARQTVESGGGPSGCRFCIDTGELNPSRNYCLRVHIDVDGDGAISPGDYVTTESYPLSDQAGPMRVRVFPVADQKM